MRINRNEFGKDALDADLEDSAHTSTRHHPVDASEREETSAKYSHERDWPVRLLVRLKLRLVGQSCSVCAAPIKRCLEKVRGVESVTVNPVLDLVFVDYDAHVTSVEEVKEAIRKSGYSAIPVP